MPRKKENNNKMKLNSIQQLVTIVMEIEIPIKLVKVEAIMNDTNPERIIAKFVKEQLEAYEKENNVWIDCEKSTVNLGMQGRYSLSDILHHKFNV